MPVEGLNYRFMAFSLMLACLREKLLTAAFLNVSRIPGSMGLREIWCGKRIYGQISLGNALFTFSTRCWQHVHEIFQWHGEQHFPAYEPKASFQDQSSGWLGPVFRRSAQERLAFCTADELTAWWLKNPYPTPIIAVGALLSWAHRLYILTVSIPLLRFECPLQGSFEIELLLWEYLGVRISKK